VHLVPKQEKRLCILICVNIQAAVIHRICTPRPVNFTLALSISHPVKPCMHETHQQAHFRTCHTSTRGIYRAKLCTRPESTCARFSSTSERIWTQVGRKPSAGTSRTYVRLTQPRYSSIATAGGTGGTHRPGMGLPAIPLPALHRAGPRPRSPPSPPRTSPRWSARVTTSSKSS
jgi:hypothetical protein